MLAGSVSHVFLVLNKTVNCSTLVKLDLIKKVATPVWCALGLCSAVLAQCKGCHVGSLASDPDLTIGMFDFSHPPPCIPPPGWAALVHLVSAALCAAQLGRPAAALDVHFPLLQAARPGGSDVGMKGIVTMATGLTQKLWASTIP